MKKTLSIIFSILCLFVITSFFLLPAIADENKLLENLVFPDAYDVDSGYDERLNLRVISYKVKLNYPSKKVLEFCNEKLNKLGWEQYIFFSIEDDRNWFKFIDGTKKDEPLVHQLGAYWNDKEKNKMILLILRYHSYTLKPKEKLYLEAPNTNILNVIVQIGPYVESTNKEKNVETQGDNQSWSQSFQFYLSHLKPMSSTDRDSCKKLLKEILNDLDSKNTCKSDDDCILTDQEPFSSILSFPEDLTDAIVIKMKNYRKQCHDEKTLIISHNDLINTPVCWKERCMVKTDFKK